MSAHAPAPQRTMKAVVSDRSGSPPDGLRLEDVDQPLVPDDGVLVRVHAASVNILDLFSLTRMASRVRSRRPARRRTPTRAVLGTDFAGTVAAVSSSVRQFQPGDEVFGASRRRGAFAEYVCVPEAGAVAHKPANATFEQAAAVPVAGITALQAVRDHGHIQPGQQVLINGASGGVGTFAVQIAKAFGAEVTAVCSTRNVDVAWSLGADRVMDYTQEDFTRSGQRYDVLLDIAGSRSWSECRQILTPKATFVAVGVASLQHESAWRTLRHYVNVRVASVGGSRKVVLFIAKLNQADLVVLRDLIEAGRVRPVIDRTYPLSEAPEAIRYLAAGHARGKVVVAV